MIFVCMEHLLCQKLSDNCRVKFVHCGNKFIISKKLFENERRTQNKDVNDTIKVKI